jgi:hypothetical protein
LPMGRPSLRLLPFILAYWCNSKGCRIMWPLLVRYCGFFCSTYKIYPFDLLLWWIFIPSLLWDFLWPAIRKLSPLRWTSLCCNRFVWVLKPWIVQRLCYHDQTCQKSLSTSRNIDQKISDDCSSTWQKSESVYNT